MKQARRKLPNEDIFTLYQNVGQFQLAHLQSSCQDLADRYF